MNYAEYLNLNLPTSFNIKSLMQNQKNLDLQARLSISTIISNQLTAFY